MYTFISPLYWGRGDPIVHIIKSLFEIHKLYSITLILQADKQHFPAVLFSRINT